MHPTLSELKKQLVQFGLNPAQWLIQKVSLQKDETYVLFRSAIDKDITLKGFLMRTQSQKFKLNALELSSL